MVLSIPLAIAFYGHAKVLNPNPLYLSQTLSHRVEITTVDIWPDILNIHLPQIFQYILCRSFKHKTSRGTRGEYQLVSKCRFLNFYAQALENIKSSLRWKINFPFKHLVQFAITRIYGMTHRRTLGLTLYGQTKKSLFLRIVISKRLLHLSRVFV